jgi:L-rhamnose-H+ transport protein
MSNQPDIAAALTVALGGLLHGSFALPMKRIARWKWENIWLVYSVVGLIVVPLALAMATVPSLAQVYENSSGSVLALIAVCGVGWGIGSTLFGLAIGRVGMALAFAIILGITSSVGSLLPLVILNPAELFARRGQILLMGLALVIAGIVICSIAGSLREKAQGSNSGAGDVSSFGTGLIICLISGLLSPALNFGFVFGKPVQDAAAAAGARPDLAANAIWVIGLGGGFLVNAGYATYLLAKNKTWGHFTQKGTPPGYWLGAALMGFLWYIGMSIYGMGAAAMGPLGGVMGWPIFMSVVIIMANVWGAVTGEWKGAGNLAVRLSWTGIAILVVAIAVIAQAS